MTLDELAHILGATHVSFQQEGQEKSCHIFRVFLVEKDPEVPDREVRVYPKGIGATYRQGAQAFVEQVAGKTLWEERDLTRRGFRIPPTLNTECGFLAAHEPIVAP